MVTPRPLQMFRYAGKAAFAIACLGITNLVLQATLDWNAGYVGTEIVFTVFACVAMFAGKFIAFRIPQRLSETRSLLGSVRERSTPTTELFSKIGPSVMLLSLGLVIGVASLWTHIQLGIPWQAGPVRFFYLASVLLNFSF